MSVSYIISSQENIPSMSEVEKSVVPKTSQTLHVLKSVVPKTSSNSIYKSVVPKTEMILTVEKSVVPKTRHFDGDTLNIMRVNV